MKKIFTLITAALFAVNVNAQDIPSGLVYLLDFEGATSVSDFGGVQHGSGVLVKSDDPNFGTYYQNWPDASGDPTLITNYLEVVPETNPWQKLIDNGLTEFTVSFWVNATVANTNSIGNYWGSLFTVYSNAGVAETREWYYPVGPDLRYQGQFHYNNWGYCDNNHDDYMPTVGAWSADNNWHHFAWVFSEIGETTSFKLTLYVDGTQIFSITEAVNGDDCVGSNMLNDMDRFVIGGASPIWADPDNAYGYDDIAIYSSALTQSQVEYIITQKKTSTGISSVKTTSNTTVRYSLAGRKIDAAYKGVVIENGKKFVVK